MYNKLLVVCLLFLLGCSSAAIPHYIKAERPYLRKVSGSFEDIVATVKDVLYKQGWLIQQETDPTMYERRDGKESGGDVLLFTEIKQHSKLAYATYTHLNVYIYANADGAEIDIRYEAITPRPVKRSVYRNDRLVNKILDAVEQEVEMGSGEIRP